MLRKILLFVLLLLIAIQFYPKPARNVAVAQSPMDISTKINVPANVQAILKESCNDCHSNNTHYPWYANLQPVAWWLGEHIKDGKKHLDFSSFGGYSLRKQYHKLEEIAEMVAEDEMPLKSYTVIHTGSKLSAAQKDLLIQWSKSARQEMEAKYPADSLSVKK
ncbi:MAG: cytochrome C [Chitinophagaceae bacterium]|nr:MAG: cytochrome C [Chitinophagaceae bacterium]